MENDLEILQNIIQNEYNNNKNIQFGDIRIAKPSSDGDNTLYFYRDKQEIAKVELYKANTILELIVGKMHNELILARTDYVDLVNDIYEPIYKLYKEYIRENNYYV